MSERVNPILTTDSYKASHFLQYPPNADGYYGYIEARKPLNVSEPFNETVFFGLQMFLNEYLSTPITYKDIDEAEWFFTKHGEPFNREGWEHILKEYNGYIPVTIRAVPEGTVVPEGNVLATVECLDPKVFWVGSYIETSLLRAIWYPSTVCTLSRECKKVLMESLNESSDNPEENIKFKLHDFGARGVSSRESARIGGAAHLVNFMGSDTVEGVLCANEHYGIDMSGYSIPAAEHSTITSWGKDNEVLAYWNMLSKFGGKGKVFACVSDSYDIYNACEHLWGRQLKQSVMDSGATVVIRPDSGYPPETVVKCLTILKDKFGSITNRKGYEVLNHVRVIQGDGINLQMIKEICKEVLSHKFSLDNVNFGMGGALLQHLNRDTLRFAMKCSSLRTAGEWHDVYKSPVGDAGKKSKAGRISLYAHRTGHGTSTEFVTMRIYDYNHIPDKMHYADALNTVYVDGRLMNLTTFDEVRKRASL